MGGKGSGRKTAPKKIPEQRTPIGTGMYLPNLSGAKRHQEISQNFLYIDGSNANQDIDIGNNDLTAKEIKIDDNNHVISASWNRLTIENKNLNDEVELKADSDGTTGSLLWGHKGGATGKFKLDLGDGDLMNVRYWVSDSTDTDEYSLAKAKSAYTHSTDNSQAHSDYLINNGNDSTSGTLTAGGFTTAGDIILDSDVKLFSKIDTNDIFRIEGQTASVNTRTDIAAKDGKYADLRLYSGSTNYGVLRFSDADNLILKNNVENKNIIFKVNDGGVAKTITLDSSVFKLKSSTGTFDFHDDNLTTTGNITADGGIGTFSQLDVDTLNFNGNSITDSTGSIDFDNENLKTDGYVEIGGSDPVRIIPDSHALDFQNTGTDLASAFRILPNGSPSLYGSNFDIYYNDGTITSDDEFMRLGSRRANTEYWIRSIAQNSGSHRDIRIDSGGNSNLYIKTDGTLLALPTYSNTVGGTNRDLYIDNSGYIGYVSSSLKYKENIRDLENTERVYELRPVMFDRKDGSASDEVGLIAEEAEKFMPEIISYKQNIIYKTEIEEDGTEVKEIDRVEKTNIPETVNYSQLIIPLLKEVQKLRAEVNELKNAS